MSVLDFMMSEDDAINMLKRDHTKVKELFDDYAKAEDRRSKNKIAAEAIEELKIHATIEEEIFYPAIREQQVDDSLMNEADEEHHVAKLLIAELDQMNGAEEHFDAKFKVLSENIRHHIKEEEGKIMPQARKTSIDFEALGRALLAMKERLKKEGVPVTDEEKMISHYGIKDDSPANARKRQSSKAGGKPVHRAHSVDGHKKMAAKTIRKSKSTKHVN